MDSIEILKRHNEWRRGGEGKMQNPTEIGIAIDDVVRDAEVLNYFLETCSEECAFYISGNGNASAEELKQAIIKKMRGD